MRPSSDTAPDPEPNIGGELSARLVWPPDPLGAAGGEGPLDAPSAAPSGSGGLAGGARTGPGGDPAPGGPSPGDAVEALRLQVSGLATVVDQLREAVEALGRSATGGGGDAVVDGLDALREEVVALRRRIALRGQAEAAPVDDDRLERVVERVLRRVEAGAAASRSRR